MCLGRIPARYNHIENIRVTNYIEAREISALKVFRSRKEPSQAIYCI